MRIEGKLCKWNDDRGFGFIAPSQGGPEVFAHISAFPKDGQRPKLGESLSFEIEIHDRGKKRAKSISRPVRIDRSQVRTRKPGRPKEKRGLIGRAVALVVVVALGMYGHREYTSRSLAGVVSTSPSAGQFAGKDSTAGFRCDGRIHCSQMTSCAEATYFLRNCPGVKMDGDGDGVPCEQQWCSGR